MDRILRRRLGAIAGDNHAGAAELALRAVQAVQDWLRREPRPARQQFREHAGAVQRAQPQMAPMWRMARAMALAAEAPQPASSLLAACSSFAAILAQAPSRIARQFAASLPRGKATVITYSYSSTVLRAVIQGRSRIERVICSECRPLLEGREMAARLARAGLRVVFVSDAELPLHIKRRGTDGRQVIVVSGADAVLPRWFINRAGTETLLARAEEAGARFWILSDTTKFAPEEFAESAVEKDYWGESLWSHRPRGIEIRNMILAATLYRPGVRLLCEQGWMTPGAIVREIRRTSFSAPAPRNGSIANPASFARGGTATRR